MAMTPVESERLALEARVKQLEEFILANGLKPPKPRPLVSQNSLSLVEHSSCQNALEDETSGSGQSDLPDDYNLEKVASVILPKDYVLRHELSVERDSREAQAHLPSTLSKPSEELQRGSCEGSPVAPCEASPVPLDDKDEFHEVHRRRELSTHGSVQGSDDGGSCRESLCCEIEPDKPAAPFWVTPLLKTISSNEYNSSPATSSCNEGREGHSSPRVPLRARRSPRARYGASPTGIKSMDRYNVPTTHELLCSKSESDGSSVPASPHRSSTPRGQSQARKSTPSTDRNHPLPAMQYVQSEPPQQRQSPVFRFDQSPNPPNRSPRKTVSFSPRVAVSVFERDHSPAEPDTTDLSDPPKIILNSSPREFTHAKIQPLNQQITPHFNQTAKSEMRHDRPPARKSPRQGSPRQLVNTSFQAAISSETNPPVAPLLTAADSSRRATWRAWYRQRRTQQTVQEFKTQGPTDQMQVQSARKIPSPRKSPRKKAHPMALPEALARKSVPMRPVSSNHSTLANKGSITPKAMLEAKECEADLESNTTSSEELGGDVAPALLAATNKICASDQDSKRRQRAVDTSRDSLVTYYDEQDVISRTHTSSPSHRDTSIQTPPSLISPHVTPPPPLLMRSASNASGRSCSGMSHRTSQSDLASACATINTEEHRNREHLHHHHTDQAQRLKTIKTIHSGRDHSEPCPVKAMSGGLGSETFL